MTSVMDDFSNMTDEQLEAEWKLIERIAEEEPDLPFHTVRAMYIVREQMRRIRREVEEITGRTGALG